MSTLRIKDISCKIGNRTILDNISMEVKSSMIIGVLGPNGAGKTTIFSMITGLTKPDSGKIYLDDMEINRLSINERAKIGITYLPQEPSIFRDLTVYENILAICQLRGELSKKQQISKVEELMDEFRLHDIRNSKGSSLSGGERRRTEIARALSLDPNFILLDEPFAAIDPLSINDTKNIILKLKDKNIGVLITDHNVNETLSISDSSYIVKDGKIICHGNKEAILSNAEVKSSYLGKEFKI